MNGKILRYLLCSLFVTSFALGCDGDPEKRETIRELRVLGIQADPPTAKPGSKVKLSALAVNYPASSISYAWYSCTDPTTALKGCHTGSNGKKISDKIQAELNIPNNYLEKQTPEEAFQGKYFFVTLVIKAEKEEVVSIKRIVISKNLTNQNPTLKNLALSKEDGTTPQSKPYNAMVEKEYKLTPSFGDSVRESYNSFDATGKKVTLKEKLFLSWYTTEGTFHKGYLTQEGKLENSWSTPKEIPKDPKAKIYLIIRDGRGGVSWKDLTISIK